MTHMHTKKKNKVIKRIIGIVAAVILLMTAIVAIILFHYLRKPQVKFAQAMANTIGSCKDSELNKKLWNLRYVSEGDKR